MVYKKKTTAEQFIDWYERATGYTADQDAPENSRKAVTGSKSTAEQFADYFDRMTGALPVDPYEEKLYKRALQIREWIEEYSSPAMKPSEIDRYLMGLPSKQ